LIPDNLRYSKEHEWVKLEGDIATIGVTDYAQGELGDIVFIELPGVGAKLELMKPFGTIEAVKAVSDIFAPVTGTVAEINAALEADAALVNSDPYGDGWIVKVKIANKAEFDQLLDAKAYAGLIGQN
jgi:glycine cleavage system H protein